MTESKVAIEAEFTLLRSQIAGVKRRKLERYRCPIAAMGKLQFPNSNEKLDVWVINLSRGGIGINLSHPIASGAQVTICLKSYDQKTLFQKDSRVVHSTEQIDGSWRVGCEFATAMSDDELDTLL